MDKHLKMLPLALFSAVAVKSIVKSISYQDVLVGLACAGMFLFLSYLQARKEKDQVQEQLSEQLQKYNELAKRVDDLSTHVAATKLSNMRQVR